MEHILENVTDSIWAIDKDYRVLYLNNAFRTEFLEKIGVDLKAGDNALTKTPKEVRAFWKEKYDMILEGKQRFTFDTEVFGKDNKITYIRVSLSPIVEKNKVTGVTCFGRNITRDKLISMELERYSLLLKVSPESQKDTILFTIDKNYKYMYFNSAHYEVMKYAYDAEIEVGRNILECISNRKDREAAYQNYTRALNGESHHNIRIYGDKNKEYYESFFNPIYDSTQNIIGATGMARNITERVVQQKALKKSEESLRKANATKNKFFSLLAHDLKSPTASLRSFLQLFYENFESFEPSKQKSILKNIRKDLDNLYRLLENLLLWSLTQINSIDFNPAKFNISNTTDEILDIYDRNLKNKGITILKNYEQDLEVYADEQMISSVIRNLISNAIKYSHKDGKVEISIKIENEDHKHLSVSVIDQGVGIAKEREEKIFRIGKYSATPGTRNEKGTGLGLILCKEFIDMHKGKISITSRENQGTTVRIEIPQMMD